MLAAAPAPDVFIALWQRFS